MISSISNESDRRYNPFASVGVWILRCVPASRPRAEWARPALLLAEFLRYPRYTRRLSADDVCYACKSTLRRFLAAATPLKPASPEAKSHTAAGKGTGAGSPPDRTAPMVTRIAFRSIQASP